MTTRNMELRKEIDTMIKRMNKDMEKLCELGYVLWESENGPLMEGIPVTSFGPKRVLHALGYVI